MEININIDINIKQSELETLLYADGQILISQSENDLKDAFGK